MALLDVNLDIVFLLHEIFGMDLHIFIRHYAIDFKPEIFNIFMQLWNFLWIQWLYYYSISGESKIAYSGILKNLLKVY